MTSGSDPGLHAAREAAGQVTSGLALWACVQNTLHLLLYGSVAFELELIFHLALGPSNYEACPTLNNRIVGKAGIRWPGPAPHAVLQGCV